MNYSSNTQLKAFLDHKLEEIQAATKNDLTRSDEFVNALSLQTGEINGYRTKHINERNFSLLGCDGGWRISINASCHIDMSFEKKGQSLRVVIRLYVNGIKSGNQFGTPAMFYKCLDQFSGIEQELLEMLQKMEKKENEKKRQKKIKEISKNSIKTWLKEILKSLPYSYYIVETKHKITLSIKLEQNMQLDIPIACPHFQSIIPHIEETIREYEAVANGSKVRVMIAKSLTNQKWNDPLNF
jgi:hypothetical protein